MVLYCIITTQVLNANSKNHNYNNLLLDTQYKKYASCNIKNLKYKEEYK